MDIIHCVRLVDPFLEQMNCDDFIARGSWNSLRYRITPNTLPTGHKIAEISIIGVITNRVTNMIDAR